MIIIRGCFKNLITIFQDNILFKISVGDALMRRFEFGGDEYSRCYHVFGCFNS
jgi:hypothetical protein